MLPLLPRPAADSEDLAEASVDPEGSEAPEDLVDLIGGNEGGTGEQSPVPCAIYRILDDECVATPGLACRVDGVTTEVL